MTAYRIAYAFIRPAVLFPNLRVASSAARRMMFRQRIGRLSLHLFGDPS
jgi:hypothetical protein